MNNRVARYRSSFVRMTSTLMAGAIIVVLLAVGKGDVAEAQLPEFSPQVLSQLQALAEAKASRTPAQRKISSRLLRAHKKYRGDPIARGIPALRSDIAIAPDGSVLVDINAQVTDTVLKRIKDLGGDVVSHFPQYNAIRARMPIGQLELLATMPEVQSIRSADEATTNKRTPQRLPRPPAPPSSGLEHGSPLTRADRAEHIRNQLHEALPRLAQARSAGVTDGPITNKVNTSQGDVAHRANTARSTYAVNGTGIRIGVLSDGVDTLAARQATGDLPPTVTVLAGQAGSGDEGTAMLEIVYDLAPGAQLYFATAFNGQASFAQNILDLQAAGCDIIVDDVIYFAESVFQDGIVAQAVNTVTANGVLFFSSAGNSGNKNDNTSGVWEGDFVGATAIGGVTGTPHNFGGGVRGNTITVDSPSVFTLQWSDAAGGASNDYDLYLMNAALTTILDVSDDVQNGTQNPFEAIDSTTFNDINSVLVVVLFSGAGRYLHLNTNRGRLAINTSGQTWGHSATVNAFSVAAVDVATAGGGVFVGGATNPVETFSSDGLRRVFYNANGTAITPGNFSSTGGVVRQKPDIAAADCVSTSTPGFATFCGTSAAAPHAAAIAALILERNPALGVNDVRTIFNSSSLDIEAAGVDRDSGVGIVNAFAAVGLVTVQANLGITKTDGASTEVPGTTVTYTIVASNAGPSTVSGATVADTFPAALTGCTWTCTGASGGTCPANGSGNISTSAVGLPVGGTATFTATCTIAAGATGTVSNTATIAAPGGVTDPTPANNSATDSDTLTPQANLSITKTDGVTTVTAGTSTTYTIVVANAGPSNATGATVADTFPAACTSVSWSCVGAGGTCTASGSGNLNTSATLPSGGSVTYTATCNISASASGTLTNTATVTAPGGVTDPTPANNSATDSDTIFNPSCSYSLAPLNQVTTASGGALQVNVTATAGCNWTAISNVPWVTITSGSAGTGNGTVQYTVSSNAGPNPRRGTLTVAGKPFIVSQDTPVPDPCTISVPATSGPVPSTGGTGSVPVTASTGSCKWSAQSQVAWITLTPPVSGTGNGAVGYSVGENPGGPRTGRITINGKRVRIIQN